MAKVLRDVVLEKNYVFVLLIPLDGAAPDYPVSAIWQDVSIPA